jgi:predicted AAA+ superfamily ATPase
VLDTEALDIVVSGSSARILSREIHSSLRGRALPTVITPFSCREALRHRGEEPAERVDRLPPATRSVVEKRLREYLVAGGFPEAQGVGKRPLDRATRLSLLQGYNIAKDTVHALLDHLIDAFVIAAVPVATESERRRNTNPRKLYPADPGLIDAFDTSGRPNTGHALETAVFNELSRRGAAVSYVKTSGGFEVDFLAQHPDGRQELVQVCADAADTGNWQRETRALDAARDDHPRAERTIVVLDTITARSLSHPKTRVLPAHQWLLAES